MLSWFRRPDREFDDAWREVLERNVWQYRVLDPPRRERVHTVVAKMVPRVHWEGGSGFAVTDEMRATVSGAAALMTLGLDEPFDFPKLHTVILYERGYRDRSNQGATILGGSSDPIFGEQVETSSARLGEAWQWGPVVLSWRDTLRSARARGRGDNLVLHEFAHHLDGLDGSTDGVPRMPTHETERLWYEVTEDEYHRLVGQARRHEVTLLDQYGATNRAEFFAVSTECFFERPHDLKERHAELFGLLATFYRQDPSEWVPRHSAEQRRPRRRCRAPLRVDLRGLGLRGADALFTRGCELANHGDYRAAEEAFTEALKIEPDDPETFTHRAEIRLELDDVHGALDDALQALTLDPRDVAPRLVAADAYLTLGHAASAAPLVRSALSDDRSSAYAWMLSGWIELEQGHPKKAERACRESLRLDALSADAHYLMAEALDAQGREDQAATHRRRADQLGLGASAED